LRSGYSTNFDSRSLALNEEVGIGLLDQEVASQFKSAFHADLQRSTELNVEQWRKRPWHSRLWSWVAYQIHDQL
jgi:cardiolipin synthase